MQHIVVVANRSKWLQISSSNGRTTNWEFGIYFPGWCFECFSVGLPQWSMVGWMCVRFRNQPTPKTIARYWNRVRRFYTQTFVVDGILHIYLYCMFIASGERRVLFHICLVMAINLSIGYICTYIPIDLCINRYPIAPLFIPHSRFLLLPICVLFCALLTQSSGLCTPRIFRVFARLILISLAITIASM